VELGPRGRAARRQHGRAVEARNARLALAQRARQSVRGLELLAQLHLLRLPGGALRESAKGGRAPRGSGLSMSPRSLHGCMPRTRVTTSPAVRLLACAGLDSVQAGLAGGQTWQRGVRLETQSLPCTDRDMRLLRQAHTCARNSFRALDMQSAQPPRASTSTCPQYAGRACARRGCKMRVAPAPAAHQRLLGQQRGVLLQARDTPLRRGLLSALRRAAVTPAGLVCLLVGVQRSDVGLLHARAIGVRSA